MTWRRSEVASGGTHHTIGGAPMYERRFDEVLAFHAPGLAPVRKGEEAWHIRADGTDAYGRRFRRTFGFYEGRAAVAGSDGWHHVAPDGADIYPARYAWCGNYQGGRCAVREPDGGYLHLEVDGAPAYAARWRYAGDFRNGVGVVQAADGRSTHIDTSGRPVHGAWFLDLDVFHKGFARARDDRGWTHVDVAGRPVYERRFAAVEPFYNGQARVERHDGSLEVIDESGRTTVELRPALRSEFASLSGDLVGFWRTQTICAAVEVGVFEALPNPAEAVAAGCGLSPGRARRLLRALAELRLTRRQGVDWVATERGEYLRAGHPLTLADAAVEYGRHFPRLWESLPDALRDDGDWRPPDIFGAVAEDPARAAGHHRMLESYAVHDYGAVPAALQLRGDERVVDAGGGLGVLANLLVERYPDLHVLVLERPEVVELAAQRRAADRIEFETADIFLPWDVEADAVVMARVLHDWDHANAVALLRNARRALPEGGRIYVVELLVPEDGVSGSLCDLHLLMATGGAERTASEYARLLAEAGFEPVGVRRLPALPSVIVGVAR